MKAALFASFLLLGSFTCQSQQLLGKWTGLLSQEINGDFYYELVVDKIQGSSYIGTVTTTAVNSAFTGKARYRVVLKKLPDGKISYQDEGIIDSTKQTNFYWCKKVGALTLAVSPDSLVMSGRWSSPTSSCPPGTLKLTRLLREKPVIAAVEKEHVQRAAIGVRVRGLHLTVEVWDFDAVDEDSISMKINGKPVGAGKMMLPAYKLYGSREFTFPIDLVKGENTLEIFAANEGIKPLNTVGILITDDDGSQKYYFSLKSHQSCQIRFLRI